MMLTTRVRLDRIASSTRNAHLSPEVILSEQIVAAEGYVLAVRICEDKPTYNTVEDLSGRMVPLRAGDRVLGVLFVPLFFVVVTRLFRQTSALRKPAVVAADEAHPGS